MYKNNGAALALVCVASAATAGGIERSDQSVAILFEDGTYAELSFARVFPSVDGELGGIATGDIAPGYNVGSLAYRQDITPNLSFAFILDTNIGADVAYPSGTGYVLASTNAEVVGRTLTALLRYEFANNVSVYGGLRAGQTSGDAELLGGLGFLPYTLETSTETELAYVVGIAYEIPDIALRVALTYNSEYTHTFDAVESTPAVAGGAAIGTQFDTTIPQSFTLEAQTGVAPGTLVFGSVRWVEWTAFQIAPTNYAAVTGSPLVSYDEDVWTYTIGVGRQFTDEFSGAVELSWEPEGNYIRGNLSPTDGFFGIGVGGSYSLPNGVDISAGVRYSVLGNVDTTLGANFSENDLWAAGVTIGMAF